MATLWICQPFAPGGKSFLRRTSCLHDFSYLTNSRALRWARLRSRQSLRCFGARTPAINSVWILVLELRVIRAVYYNDLVCQHRFRLVALREFSAGGRRPRGCSCYFAGGG